MRACRHATDHPYYERAAAHARATGRPLAWAFWDLGLWRPLLRVGRRGVELRAPQDPRGGLPGAEFCPVALPETPPGWRRRRVGRRWVDTAEPSAVALRPTHQPQPQPELPLI